MTKAKKISVIIIARNESQRIAKCLESVAWAGEILVIDNASTDDTVAIAKASNAIVIEEKIQDFSKIRFVGAEHATGEWLLYVDADELVSLKLQNEILRVIDSATSENAYFIPRQNYYLGRLWPTRDGMVRLIRKNKLIRWEGILHEHAVVSGKTGRLENYLIHNTHRSIEEMVVKTNEWSMHEAKLRFDSHHPPISWWRLLRVMLTAFFTSYISEGGWRVGTVGWIESIYQAFSIYITYAKLWEMQQKS